MDPGPALVVGLSLGAVGFGHHQRRYTLLAPIERGGMGELFLARAAGPDHPAGYVVIKHLLTDLVDDEKYVAMFRSEAEVMSKLDHPNIVRVFDLPIIEGSQCLAMEYVRGRNVQQILARCLDLNAMIPPEIVLRIMQDVLRGLHYAHDLRLEDGAPLNLVHRDVTPANILVSFDGDVKLTDFGIAKSLMSAVSTTVGIVKGKARYLAPEQILGEPATPRSDVFSCACVTLEMLTGVPTFDRGSVPKTLYAIVNGQLPDIESSLSFRAPLLVQTLQRAFSVNPDDRFQTAGEFRESLQAAEQLLNRSADAAALGKYVSELFRDVEDPIQAYFDSQHPPPATPPPPPQQAAPRAAAPAVPFDETQTKPDDDRGEGPLEAVPPPLPPHGDQTAVDDVDEALAAAANSAHSSRQRPNIVRGQPVAPPPADISGGATRTGEVDHALAVLAYLQSQRAAEAPPPEPVSEPPAAAPSPPPRPPVVDAGPTRSLELLRPRTPAWLVFAIGVACGVVGTILFQPAAESPPPTLERTDTERATPPRDNTPVRDEAPTTPTLASPEPAAASKPPPVIDVVYPRGGRIEVDGQRLPGRIPIEGVELTPGTHTLKIRRNRYRREHTITIEAGERWEIGRQAKRVAP